MWYGDLDLVLPNPESQLFLVRCDKPKWMAVILVDVKVAPPSPLCFAICSVVQCKVLPLPFLEQNMMGRMELPR